MPLWTFNLSVDGYNFSCMNGVNGQNKLSVQLMGLSLLSESKGAWTDDLILGQQRPTLSDTTVFTTCRIKIAVSMAWSEYTSGGPRAPVLVGCRSSIADLVNQIVMSPRRRKASLYSGQWATLYRSFLNL